MKKKRRLKKKVVKQVKFFLFAILFLAGISFLFHGKAKENEKLPEYKFLEMTELKEITKFLQYKSTYPETLLTMYDNNPDMLSFMADYHDSVGKVTSDTIGPIKKGEVPLLLQYDKRWGYAMYGDEVIAIGGCAPTSLAMVIAYLTDSNEVTPAEIADYAYQNGYYVRGSGSSWTLLSEGVKHFGVTSKTVPLVKATIFSYLESGKPIIASMGPGDFTRGGHFIVFAGVQDGKIKVNDPNSKERSNKLWSYEQIESQIKNLWVFERMEG